MTDAPARDLARRLVRGTARLWVRGTSRRLALIAAAAALATGCGGTAHSGVLAASPLPELATSGGLTLTLEHRGLLLEDPFDRPQSLARLQKRYELNGSAVAADRFASVDAAGLHVGVREHAAGLFEGYFAVTHAGYPASSVFRVRMARQDVDAPQKDRSGESVFAVQTGTTKKTGIINYVLVASSTNAGLTHWLVGYAEGHVADAKTTVLWQSTYLKTAQAEKYQDITLRTDGATSLDVWFGARLVYSSHTLVMHIDPPLQPYLEVQGLQIGYTATFTDFSVVGDSSIVVRGLRPGEKVTFVPTAKDRVSATASATGEARIPLPLPAVRGAGDLVVNRDGEHVLGPFSYSGGDVYRLHDTATP